MNMNLGFCDVLQQRCDNDDERREILYRYDNIMFLTMGVGGQTTKMEPSRYSYRWQSGWTQTLLMLALLQAFQTPLLGPTVVVAANKLSASCSPLRFSSPPTTLGVIFQVRGGAKADGPRKKNKKKAAAARKKKSASASVATKKKKTASTSAPKDKKKKKSVSADADADAPTNKKKIEKVLKEKDTAQALGDAIRDRAGQLRRESPFLERIDQSVASIGWAMGASDRRLIEEPAEDAAGGVEAAPTSVLVHYFLKSHGGAHALQCICSLLATIAGLGSMLLPCSSPLCLTLMKRCMLFAMVKHVSGLLATTFLAARAIPDVGFREARVWMEQLATDPVSQYVFYTACTMLWLPDRLPTNGALWWQSHAMIPSLLVGPVVLREIISTVLVLSDVLVLWICGSSEKGDNLTVKKLLSLSQSLVNAVMSILVTPKIWRSANAAQRQEILAKLISKLSLALEVLVGLLFAADAAKGVVEFSFASLSQRPPFFQLVKRLLCTRLYLHFLWTRRRKINRLATKIRGGAGKLPMYVLDVLSDPRSSMGLPKQSPSEELTWKGYIALALGFESA
jgi:hypothetical protein